MNKRSAIVFILKELQREMGSPYINLEKTIEKAEQRYGTDNFVIQYYTFNRDYFFIISKEA